MKNILMVVYSFPPSGMSGVYRSLGFVRHLPQNEWRPTVITVPEDSYATRDDSLVARVPPSAVVHRIPYWGSRLHQRLKTPRSNEVTNPDPSSLNAMAAVLRGMGKAAIQYILIPDQFVTWVPNATRAGAQVMRTDNIDVIYSSSPPNSAHLAAYLLKRRSGIPWVADYRDPSLSFLGASEAPLRHQLKKRLEARVVRHADKIVTVTENLKRHMLGIHGEKYCSKFHVIMNGYEPEDFRGLERQTDESQFVVTHTGRFYSKRTPVPFLNACRELVDSDSMLREKLRIRLVGEADNTLQQQIANLRMQPYVEFIGPVTNRESLRYQCDSDVLLLVPGTSSHTTPGKIFEYFGAGKVILALTETGTDTETLIKESGSGITVDPGDEVGIRAAISDLFQQHQQGRLSTQHHAHRVEEYSRQNQTKRLACLCEELCSRRPQSGSV